MVQAVTVNKAELALCLFFTRSLSKVFFSEAFSAGDMWHQNDGCYATASCSYTEYYASSALIMALCSYASSCVKSNCLPMKLAHRTQALHAL